MVLGIEVFGLVPPGRAKKTRAECERRKRLAADDVNEEEALARQGSWCLSSL